MLELSKHGDDVIKRVEAGESLVVTREGRPVAQLRPLPHAPLTIEQVIARWQHLPPMDPVKLRADVDAVIEQTLP